MSAFAGLAAVVSAPVLVGAVHRWAICLSLAAVVVFGWSTLALSRLDGGPTSRPHILVWLFFALACVSLLQLIPLPIGVVEVLSSTRAELAVDNARALQDTLPTWLPLSYDVPATVVEAAKYCGYTVFCGAAMYLAARNPAFSSRIAETVVCVGCGLAVIALIHLSLDLRNVFGVFETSLPPGTPQRLLSPLVSVNHLAAFLAMTIPVALGLACSRRDNVRRVWLLCAAICGGVLVLTGSRGGYVSAAVGVVVFGGVYGWQARRQRYTQRRAAFVSTGNRVALICVILCAVVVIGNLGYYEVQRGLESFAEGETRDGERYAVWRAAIDLIHENFWTGVGKGSFEVAFTRWSPSAHHTFSHAENGLLQTAAAWGVPTLCVVLGFFVVLARKAVRVATISPRKLGCAAGLAGLLVHNLVDFNLELMGVCLPAIALATCVFGGTRERGVSDHRASWIVVGFLVIASFSVVAAGSGLGIPARTSSDRVAQVLATDGHASRSSIDGYTLAVEAFTAHPSDYVAAYYAALAHRDRNDERAVALLNRALYLNPQHYQLHLTAAQWLVDSANRSQALVEYRLALRNTVDPDPILRSLAANFDDAQALEALPIGKRGQRIAHRLLALGRESLASQYASKLARQYPYDLQTVWLAAQAAMRTRDFRQAVALATRAWRLGPSSKAALLVATAHARAGDREVAIRVLQQAIADAGGLEDVTALKQRLDSLRSSR